MTLHTHAAPVHPGVLPQKPTKLHTAPDTQGFGVVFGIHTSKQATAVGVGVAVAVGVSVAVGVGVGAIQHSRAWLFGLQLSTLYVAPVHVPIGIQVSPGLQLDDALSQTNDDPKASPNAPLVILL